MGVSTDAYLAFGFDLGDESIFSEMDFEDWYDANIYNKNLPYDVVIHCSYDYPMHFLAVTSSVQIAKRGYPEKATMPEITSETISAMQAFCEEYEIDWKEPAWHIFSLWG